MRYKVAVRFVIEGDLRFISHHDTMRLFERALARARLPVKFSEGFNPRPRLSLPLPRPVGVAGSAELLIIELTEPAETEAFRERLERQLPSGLKLASAGVIEGRTQPQAVAATYRLLLPPDRHTSVGTALRRILSAGSWPIERETHGEGRVKTVDLRAYLQDAGVDDHELHWTTRVDPGGSLRPAEILTAVGLDPPDWLHRVRRTEIEWDRATA